MGVFSFGVLGRKLERGGKGRRGGGGEREGGREEGRWGREGGRQGGGGKREGGRERESRRECICTCMIVCLWNIHNVCNRVARLPHEVTHSVLSELRGGYGIGNGREEEEEEEGGGGGGGGGRGGGGVGGGGEGRRGGTFGLEEREKRVSHSHTHNNSNVRPDRCVYSIHVPSEQVNLITHYIMTKLFLHN